MRQILSGKNGNKNFYKGTGTGSIGRWNAKGDFVIQPHKLKKFVIPELSGFNLTPFINPKHDPKAVRLTHSLLDYFSGDSAESIRNVDVEFCNRLETAAKQVLFEVRYPKK